MTRLVNGLSVDVEEHFQVGAFQHVIPQGSWDSIPSRVRGNVDRLLQIFDDHAVKATFFILGWVAKRHPGMIKDIQSAGHEIASHGSDHQLAYQQTPESFRDDVAASKAVLEDLCGQAVIGYRAPSFSITAQNLWAFEILEELGFRYSSSIYPIRHDTYGLPDASRFPFQPEGRKIVECPQSTVEVGPMRLPCGGGGYLRLFPFWLFRRAVGRVNATDQQSMYLYIHPWEIDPEQPRIDGAGLKSNFRHYRNLHKTEGRLIRLLEEFRWDRFDRILGFEPQVPANGQATDEKAKEQMTG